MKVSWPQTLSSVAGKGLNQIVPTASSSIGLWIWLFPLAYGLHIAEEYWLHFPDWVSRLSGSFVSNTQFLVLNGVFWLLTVVSVVAIRVRNSLAWLVATLAAILGINAALHLLGGVVTRTYSPGSITASERNVNQRGRTVLATDCALAGAGTHRGRPLNRIVSRQRTWPD